MHITIVADVDPFNSKPGGTKAYIEGLMSALFSHGYEIDLIGFSNKNAEDAVFNFIPVTNNINASGYAFFLNLLLKSPFFNIGKNSIIHANRPDMMLPFVLFHKNNFKVCTIHGIPKEGMFFRKGRLVGSIYSSIEKYALKRVNSVIAISSESERYYTSRYPFLKEKITIIPTGFDSTLFKPLDRNETRAKYGFLPDDNIILYVGRFEAEKRLTLLIDAYAIARQTVKDLKLLLVGSGREEQELKDYASSKGLNNVIFMGTVKHENVPEIINCVDVFALTSAYEGMPTVILESLACGVPVVSTNVGDVNNVVINDRTGYLVPEDDSTRIASKLEAVLLEKDRFQSYCIMVASEYKWENIFKRILEIYMLNSTIEVNH